MKHIVQNFWLRFLASAAIASVVVVVAVGAAIRYYRQPKEEPPQLEFEFVKVVNLADNPVLADAIRKEREKYTDPNQDSAPPPPPPLPERMVSGFVHVEYVINPDGSVSDVRVVGAAPSGVYEQQAVEQVARSMHAPAYNADGEAIARRATEIVEFSVPASELAGSQRQSEQGGG